MAERINMIYNDASKSTILILHVANLDKILKAYSKYYGRTFYTLVDDDIHTLYDNNIIISKLPMIEELSTYNLKIILENYIFNILKDMRTFIK